MPALHTPVAFFAFNRPEPTRAVFAAIRQARPTRLFLVTDGPRNGNENDQENVPATRAVIESMLDWNCKVTRLYADTNLGCGKRVSSGLDAVFAAVDRAIVLEDDCVPESSFFPFCEEMLDRYRDDHRIASISGDNFQQKKVVRRNTYFASKHFHCWGWSSWKRAWSLYDPNLDRIRDFISSDLFKTLADENIYFTSFWEHKLVQLEKGEVDSWAFRFQFSCWIEGKLHLHPSTNLVRNIGFGPDSTHCSNSDLQMKTGAFEFPISHPKTIERDKSADQTIDRQHFGLLLHRYGLKVIKNILFKKLWRDRK